MPDTANGLNLNQDGSSLVLDGHLDADTVAANWDKALKLAAEGKTKSIDASKLTYCDGAGVALIWELQQKGVKSVEGLKPEYAKMLEPFAEAKLPEKSRKKKEGVVATIGEVTMTLVTDFREQIAFLGQIVATTMYFSVNPWKLRWADAWLIFQRAGVQALVIVGLVSFLTGLIMAFQSAVPLKQFGVDIFVINLVALAMLRELGPIMTAIVLAGRSGSAFAAEIGTMKVNEEINALTTMGVDPVRFLVAPRILAGLMVTPLLTIYANLAGIAGGFAVMLGTGYPFPALWHQLVGAVAINDIFAGLIKSVVFGMLVAGIGCLRGLQTQSGASAVGVSTTRAVVSSIFYIILVDAVFAVIFYALKF